MSICDISSKSMHAFLSNLANRQTDRQTDKRTREKHLPSSLSEVYYTNACLYLASIHQMAPLQTEVTDINCSILLIYIPRKDERLSRPGRLTYSGRFTHISGHPSAAGHAHNESSPVNDQRSTTLLRNGEKT